MNKKHQSLFLISGIIFVFILWYILAFIIGKVNFFPYPHKIIANVAKLFTKPDTYLDLLKTFSFTALGFVIAFTLALFLAFTSAFYPWVKSFLFPLVALLRALPNIVIIFILFLFAGEATLSILLVFLVSFPLLYNLFLDSYLNIDSDLIDAYRVESENYYRGFFKVFWPLIYYKSILSIAAVLIVAIKAEILGEYLIGMLSSAGIGTRMRIAREIQFNYLDFFSWAFIIIILFLLIELLLAKIKKVNEK